MKKVTTEKFSLSSLYGKTVAIADDIKNGKDVDTGLLKTIISGEGIRAEYKGKDEFEFEPFATILIGMNNIVTFNDTSDGFSRRFKVIPFNHKFVEGKNRNNNMKKLLCTPDNLKYICSKAIYYFSKVLKQDKFTVPQTVDDETSSYLLENKIVEKFLIDVPLTMSETKEVYADFKAWCKECDYTPFSSVKFGRELKRLGFRKERGTTGKRPYYYIAPDYDPNTDDVHIRLEQFNNLLDEDEKEANFQELLDYSSLNDTDEEI